MQKFTDPRFPDVEVHYFGRRSFNVFQRNENGKMDEVDIFTMDAAEANALTPEKTAEVVRRYFDHMASEYQDGRSIGGGIQELPGRRDRDHSDTFNAPSTTQSRTQLQTKVGLKDILRSGGELTHDDVLAYYDQAKRISDPVQREKAMDQVRRMASKLESIAQGLVRMLLD